MSSVNDAVGISVVALPTIFVAGVTVVNLLFPGGNGVNGNGVEPGVQPSSGPQGTTFKATVTGLSPYIGKYINIQLMGDEWALEKRPLRVDQPTGTVISSDKVIISASIPYGASYEPKMYEVIYNIWNTLDYTGYLKSGNVGYFTITE